MISVCKRGNDIWFLVFISVLVYKARFIFSMPIAFERYCTGYFSIEEK